jgi:hypothetical protein
VAPIPILPLWIFVRATEIIGWRDGKSSERLISVQIRESRGLFLALGTEIMAGVLEGPRIAI